MVHRTASTWLCTCGTLPVDISPPPSKRHTAVSVQSHRSTEPATLEVASMQRAGHTTRHAYCSQCGWATQRTKVRPQGPERAGSGPHGAVSRDFSMWHFTLHVRLVSSVHPFISSSSFLLGRYLHRCPMYKAHQMPCVILLHTTSPAHPPRHFPHRRLHCVLPILPPPIIVLLSVVS